MSSLKPPPSNPSSFLSRPGPSSLNVKNDGASSQDSSFLQPQQSARSGALGGRMGSIMQKGGIGASFLRVENSTMRGTSKHLGARMSMRPGKRDKSSGSGRRSKKKRGKDDTARVFDKKTGRDVTPQPLVNADHANTFTGVAVPSIGASTVAAGDTTDTGLYSVPSYAGDATESDFESDRDYGTLDREKRFAEEQTVTKVKEWTDKELREKISIRIEETMTSTLLFIPAVRVWGEDEKLSQEVSKDNAHYREIIEKHKEKDKYMNRSAQTFNNTTRDKEVQAAPPATKDAACDATTWDIFDSYENEVQQTENTEGEQEDGIGDFTMQVRKGGAATGAATTRDINAASPSQSIHSSHAGSIGGSRINASHAGTSRGASYFASALESGGSSGTHNSTSSGGTGVSADRPGSMANALFQTATPLERLSRLSNFKISLNALEQAALQNVQHEQQLLYRNHPEADVTKYLPTEPTKYEPKTTEFDGLDDPQKETIGNSRRAVMIPLWTFSCPLAAGVNVSCLSWNKQNKDMLAAGYGSVDFGKTNTGGLILFWSLKNPTHPQKIIHTKHSVTALDFCDEHPHLLAVGMYDGSVAIYDIRDQNDKPALESAHATGKHSEPVWGVKWVFKEASKRSQHLTSISTDGTVQQWSMKKGLVPHELMQLKRIPNRAQLLGASMEGISREASGMCFDFPINDGTQYFAGTEDGLIHKCSVSYNEQTLENFYGHTGPVYKVRCSPFLADAFISCSADWTLSLWSQKNSKPILKFQSGHDYVMDVIWSPSNSCVFGSVSRDGRVEVWDLEYSPLDPVIKYNTAKQLSCASFAPSAPVIVSGAADGTIDVFRMEGVAVNIARLASDEQAQRLDEVMYTHNESKNKLAQSVNEKAKAAQQTNQSNADSM